MKIKSSPKGFTLIELLVVVLIIGILSAVALPGYRKAVERSRVSDALTTMQAVAKSEHGWYLTNNSYTKDFSNLDIEINGTINEGALETDFYTYELLDTGILAERNNGEYILYKDYDSQQILCNPGNHYVCEDLGAFTKVPCEKLKMAWANTNSTCYADKRERCLDLHSDTYGDNVWNGSFCGYIKTSSTTLDEGMECLSTVYSGCQYTTVNNGAICQGKNYYTCAYSTINIGGICEGKSSFACSSSTINGGICRGYSGIGYSCAYSTITAGATCEGYEFNACSFSLIEGGSKCVAHGLGCDYMIINDGVCEGSGNTCRSSIINNGGECKGDCSGSVVNSGGICSGRCGGVTVKDGGKCSGGCNWSKILDGGKCISSESNYCGDTYRVGYADTGCCEGDYCGAAPKCNCPINEKTGMHKTSC